MRGVVGASQEPPKLLRSSLAAGAAMVVVGLAVFVREVCVAAAYGRSAAYDTFVLALMVPVVISSVLAAALKSSFVPVYARLEREEGEAGLQRVLGSLSWVALIAFAGFTVLGTVVAWVVTSAGAGDEPELSLWLLLLLAPVLLLNGVSLLWATVLEARRRFFVATVCLAAVPLSASAAVLLLPSGWGVFSLVLGTIAGYLLQVAIAGWALAKTGLSLRPRWHGPEPALRETARQYLPVVVGSAFLGVTTLVDGYMAAFLPEGSVSALAYGSRLSTFAMMIVSAIIGAVVLPHFSRLVVRRDLAAVRVDMRRCLAAIAAWSIPCTVFIALLSEELVALLFERGALDAGDTSEIGWVQTLYCLQIPFRLACIFCIRLISSFQRNHFLVINMVVVLTLNVVLNFVFMAYLGVAGIALSTSVVFLVSCGLLLAICRTLVGTPPPQPCPEAKESCTTA